MFQNQVRDWALAFAPDLSFIDSRIDVFVNIDENCNAYFDGNLNFMQAGNGCNNTGRIADVNFHEWGHGFHYYSLQSGEFDGAVSEGIADVIAFLNTGDPIISPHFFRSGEGIRNVEEDRVYPDDWVNEVHTDGLIFGGAVWDLWNLLEDNLGEEEGYNTVNRLLVQATKAGPTTPVAFDEFIFADDNNGDLSDGTPNSCIIIEAFAMHGLGPGGGGGLYHLNHEPVGTQIAGQAVSLQVEAINLAPDCTDAAVEEAAVFYSTNDGESWDRIVLSVKRQSAASIPARTGTTVSYYFSVDTGEPDLPKRQEESINPFTLGELTELYCENFDADDGGYRHSLVAGGGRRAMIGSGDAHWHGWRSVFAYSGNLFGARLGWRSVQWRVPKWKHNRLQSVEIDVQGATNLLLKYRRWLNVEDGYYDQANANDAIVWSNHATRQAVGDEHHKDDQWIEHVVLPCRLENR